MSFFLDSPQKEHDTHPSTGYISAYHVSRQYGGPEEGGWWYNAYEWLKVSIPFRAVQTVRWDDGDEDEGRQPGWRPCGPPQPADEPAQVRFQAAYYLLTEIFGEETNTRGSVLSDGDIEFIIEREPGERGEWPRPRYE